MARASSTYQPRRPEQGALHQLVRDHFETFRAQAAHLRDGQGLPRFVEQEFRDFLTCGCLAAGFARFRCSNCRLDGLVPFSCKGRGFCPVGQDRLQLMPDGTAVLELRRRWTDGTTHLVFDPVELLERLAALTPRPRINLILYHGVLAPRAAWRRAVVPSDDY